MVQIQKHDGGLFLNLPVLPQDIQNKENMKWGK